MAKLKQLIPATKFPAGFLRSYLLWGALGFCLTFLLGFVWFFPIDRLTGLLEQQVADRSQIELQISGPGWSFPPGLAARRVVVSGAPLQGETLKLSQLRITPLWGSLLSGNLGASMTGKFFSGQLAAVLHQGGEVELQLQGAVLKDQKLSPQLSVLLSGDGAKVDFHGTLPIGRNNRSNGELELDHIQLSGMTALGSAKETLSLGKLELTTELQGTTVNINKLSCNGGDLQLTGSGSLILGNSPRTSRINLNLTLSPAATLDSSLRDLLGLLGKPEADGSIKLRLLGSLAAPQLR